MPASLEKRWTEEEDTALLIFYPATKEELSPLLQRHTWRAIKQRAVEFHLTRRKDPNWHHSEVTLLKELRPKMNVEELMKHFPGRSKNSLFIKAERNNVHSDYYWSDEEVNALRQYFPSRDKEKLLELIPVRNWSSIVQRARKLGIKGPTVAEIQRQIMTEKNKSEDFQTKRLKALCKKPTKPEKWLIELINEHKLPYKYVGDGDILIENLNPDFINVNGHKIIIEIFGRVWHETLVKDWKRTEDGRRKIFAKYGYRTLIIWDDELKDRGAILERIYQFEQNVPQGEKA
jgi:very-short-patch-repair endonuclease